MKNLKRLLSLALTGVMLSGMMVMGASAADFTDADEIVNTEAVDTMVALNIINGKPDGSYDPDGLVTRAEMAKMIATAVNGGVAPEFGTKPTPTYSDIKGNWAEQYIEYCYDMKYISGRGNGIFDPAGNVTGTEAAKMVLTALGYDETAYQLKGADWAINTNAIAIRTCKPSLYENLNGVNMNVAITRDTAAQIIWNGVQNHIVEWTPNREVTGTGLNYQYTINPKVTLLNRAYDAYIWVGTYDGNSKSLDIEDGCIQISKAGLVDADEDSRTATVTFLSTMGIENLGEEVKVIFKDGKGGRSDIPDRKDTIYGVFNTGAVETVIATLNDIKTGEDAPDETDKIKIGSTTYTVADAPATAANAVVRNYGAKDTAKVGTGVTEQKDYTKANPMFKNYKDAIEGLGAKTGDTIKLVLKDGKVNYAVVTETVLARVTAASSSKITLSGVGSIELEDNDVYDDVKKDDVVTYTKFYDSDKDKAFFTVTKAETVEGEITGYTGTKKVSIDGTSYNIPKDTLASSLTDDAVTSFTDKIGDEVKAYLVGGMVGAVQNLSSDTSNYALVIGATTDSTSESTLSVGRVRLMTTDGVKTTYEVDEKSDLQPTNAQNPGAKQVKAGMLVKFSVTSNNTVKISEKYTAAGDTANTTKVWNADTKVVADDAVAESGAVLYYNSAAANAEASYKVTDIRALKTLTLDAAADVFFIKNDSGKIVAAFTALNDSPAGATSTRVYGMVTGSNGTVKVGDDECTQYKVWTGEDEILVNITDTVNSTTMGSGSYVTFEETVDGTYKQANIVLVSSYDTTHITIVDGAVKEYNTSDKILSYYENLAAVNGDGLYLPEQENGKDVAPETIAMDKDLKIIFVDRNGKKAGDDVGVNDYDTTTGYANVKLLVKDDVVIVMFVETSGKCDINGDKDALEPSTPATTYTVTLPTGGDVAATGDNTGSVYTVTADKPSAAASATVTVTVKVKTAVTTGTDTLALTVTDADSGAVTVTGGSATVDNTKTAGTTVITATFTMPAKNVTVALSATNAN